MGGGLPISFRGIFEVSDTAPFGLWDRTIGNHSGRCSTTL